MHTSVWEAMVGNPVTVVSESLEVLKGPLRRGRDRGWYMLHASRRYIPLWHEDYDANGEDGILVHVRAISATLPNSTVAETPRLEAVYLMQPGAGSSGTRVPMRHRDDRQDAHVLVD